jgi:7-cyano-7-deazaguanine synthase
MTHTTILASGGLDSTTCIAYYLARGYPVRAVWVDYGQSAVLAEGAAIERVCVHYGVPLEKVTVSGITWPRLGGSLFEYRARNLTLAALAFNMTTIEAALIALGIHSGTPFADCQPSFVEQLDRLLDMLSEGTVRLDCPFLRWSKLEIASYAQAHAVPFDLTYSCERGLPAGCQECEKCRDVLAITRALRSEPARGDDSTSKLR